MPESFITTQGVSPALQAAIQTLADYSERDLAEFHRHHAAQVLDELTHYIRDYSDEDNAQPFNEGEKLTIIQSLIKAERHCQHIRSILQDDDPSEAPVEA